MNADRKRAGLLAELACRVLDPLAGDINDGNLDALARKIARAREAHAACAAGDERDALLPEQIHVSSPDLSRGCGRPGKAVFNQRRQ